MITENANSLRSPATVSRLAGLCNISSETAEVESMLQAVSEALDPYFEEWELFDYRPGGTTKNLELIRRSAQILNKALIELDSFVTGELTEMIGYNGDLLKLSACLEVGAEELRDKAKAEKKGAPTKKAQRKLHLRLFRIFKDYCNHEDLIPLGKDR